MTRHAEPFACHPEPVRPPLPKALNGVKGLRVNSAKDHGSSPSLCSLRILCDLRVKSFLLARTEKNLTQRTQRRTHRGHREQIYRSAITLLIDSARRPWSDTRRGIDGRNLHIKIQNILSRGFGTRSPYEKADINNSLWGTSSGDRAYRNHCKAGQGLAGLSGRHGPYRGRHCQSMPQVRDSRSSLPTSIKFLHTQSVWRIL